MRKNITSAVNAVGSEYRSMSEIVKKLLDLKLNAKKHLSAKLFHHVQGQHESWFTTAFPKVNDQLFSFNDIDV